jgi:hypothetical protein
MQQSTDSAPAPAKDSAGHTAHQATAIDEPARPERIVHNGSDGIRKFWLTAAGLGIGFSILTLLWTAEIREIWAGIAHLVAAATDTQTDSLAVSRWKIPKELEYKVNGLRRSFGQLTPRQPYLIVNSADNEIYLMNGRRLLHKGVCSTGSFTLLKAADQRQWIFQTPRGMYRVQVKVEAPVWRMPDWAFIEEGLPVPAPDSPERYEYGVLGEYALAFGNGYLVHGTLYQRFLGMPVTHGCVRLGDEDLKKVYFALDIGSKIFIY